VQTDTPSLGQRTLDSLSGLLRRPFTELYLTHPATALRLSAAIFTAIIHDKISEAWTSTDVQSRSKWEQVAVILLAGVQVVLNPLSGQTVLIASSRITWKLTITVGYPLDIEITSYSSSPSERVKIAVAQAYYTIVCNVFFSTSSTIPLSTYSVSLRVSVSKLAAICSRKLTQCHAYFIAKR
jgi:hypothetical protein